MKFHIIGGPLDGKVFKLNAPMRTVEVPVVGDVPLSHVCETKVPHPSEFKTDRYELEHFACRGGDRVGFYRHEFMDGPASGIEFFSRAVKALDELQTLRTRIAALLEASPGTSQ